MGDFEQDTRVEAAAEGHRAMLSRNWEIWGPNGGYLCAVALRAAGQRAAIQRPVAFYAHYLRSPHFGAVELTVETLMQGRRAESFVVRMQQEGKPVLVAMVRTAREGEGLSHDTAAPPFAGAPEQLPTAESLLTAEHVGRHRFWENFDVRVVQQERFAVPRPGLPPRFLEWYRFKTESTLADPFVDACRSLILIDTMCWPAASMPHPNSGFIAPSLDVAVWFHRPATDSAWLLIDAESSLAADGTIGAQARVFSRAGKLIASGGTQLLCVPSPAPA